MKSAGILKISIVIVTMFLVRDVCHAQFFVTGDDPGRLKWLSIDTDHFRIIYPKGDDSLAFDYARNLEKYSGSVSRTTGYEISGGWGTKMPVVLHTYNGENGSVAWAPKRMDLYTIPSPYSPEPLPWKKMLAIHESRHVTQMQFGMTRAMKPFNWFFGEMFNILVSLVYPGISAMEGDCVITETAYTSSGRGRTSEFLNYYRIAFDQGITRPYVKWRYGSERYYVPNYYSLGYLTIGGMRVFYDCPDFMHRVYELSARRPYNFFAYDTVIKEVSGKKEQKAFKEICDSMAVIWKAEADARAPYTPARQIVKEPRLFMNYTNPVSTDNGIYVFRSGFEHAPALVKVDAAGREKFIRNVSSNTSALAYSSADGKIWWSESTRSARWSLKSRSIIYNHDTRTGKHKKIRTDRLLHNPEPSPDGKSIALAQYNHQGNTGITILDAESGEWRSGHQAPDSLQVVQLAWESENRIYASAVSEGGYGIYSLCLDDDNWTEVLEPQPVMIENLNLSGNCLDFTSDLDGRKEYYVFNLLTKALERKTSFRYGAEDFARTVSGDSIILTVPSLKGKFLSITPADSLKSEETQFRPQHEYFLAESLTRQEKDFSEASSEEFISSSDSISISAPKRYSKALHALNIHSWAPFYVSVDKIMNMSFDRVYQAVSLGASGILQNRLATAVGEFGYSAHKDPYEKSKWRHSAHAKLTYSGLPVVFEGSIDFNDRAARLYTNYAFRKNGNTYYSGVGSFAVDVPSIQGSIKAYLPLTFNSSGWYRGFVPKISYSINNDCFDQSMLLRSYDNITGGSPVIGVYRGKRTRVMQNLGASLRFYGSLGVPSSSIYPRWGGGIEMGISSSLSTGKIFSPMGYAYAYGYFPGIARVQGLKITALYQQKLSSGAYLGQPVVNTLPRGLSNVASLPSWAAYMYGSSAKLTADYAIPIYVGEWPIFGSFIYVNRLILTPHFDCSFLGRETLFSAGMSVTFGLQTLLWIEWPCSVGITASYNGGFNGSFDRILQSSGTKMGHFHIGPVFEVSF